MAQQLPLNDRPVARTLDPEAHRNLAVPKPDYEALQLAV
jgi:hypothetical protein